MTTQMTRRSMTPRQLDVFTAINEHIDATTLSPTYDELVKRLAEKGISLSRTTIYNHCEALEKKGWIRKDPGESLGPGARNIKPIPVHDLVVRDAVIRCIDRQLKDLLLDPRIVQLKMSISALAAQV